MGRIRRAAELDARKIQRASRLDVDGRTDPPGLQVGRRGLENLYSGNQFGCQGVERKSSPAGLAGVGRCGNLPAIDQYRVELRPESANRDKFAFTARAVNGNAGDALER